MGNKISYSGKHVLITGGSTGIGFALAELFAADGAKVTLLARSLDKLQKAQKQLQETHPAADVGIVSADVTDFSALCKKLAALEADRGAVDVAVCNAGAATPGLFVEQTMAATEQTMRVNYFGVHHTAKALLPGMLARGRGHLCFVSSAAALCGLVGYSSYAPSKSAVRSLADCLRSELQGTGVTVSIGYPPDTQTPGFDAENETKPAATRAISDAFQDQVYSPEQVAAALFRGLRRGSYHLPNPDFVLQLLVSHGSGITPKPLGWALEMLAAPWIVVVAVVARVMQDRIVRRSNAAAARTAAASCG